MAVSKPTCQCYLLHNTSFSLNCYLRTLAYDLGYSPLDTWSSHQMSVYSDKKKIIQSFTRFKEAYPAFPYANKCFTYFFQFWMHYLNNFRRKPAITRNDIAFHSQPQVIPVFCNKHGFGPPKKFVFIQPAHD